MNEDIRELEKELRHFSLIQLVMVAVILGMLAAVAVPKYSSYVTNARSSEASARLSAIMKASKGFYQSNDRWPHSPDEQGYYTDFSETRHFSYNIVRGGGRGEFILRATGFDLDGMENVTVTMKCKDVASEAVIVVKGILKKESSFKKLISLTS